jgi:transposase-like protein
MEQPGTPAYGDPGTGERIACLWCGSEHVERIGEFASQLMTEQWFCLDCNSPFEWIRKR